MESGKDYDSHIQISKGVLRNFAHKMLVSYGGKSNSTDAVYVLSLKSGAISEEKIDTFGTAANYYDPAIEKRLCEEVEGPFGAAISELRDPNKSASVMSNSEKVKDIRRYMNFSLIRAQRNHANPQIQNFAKGLGHDLTPSEVIKRFLDTKDKFDPFNGMGLSLAHNTSSVDFVIPFNCLSIFNGSDGDLIFFPFSPREVLILAPLNGTQEDGLILKQDDFSEEKMVCFINNLALGTENKNVGLIIGKNKEELNRLNDLKH
jgi:hypothetical protein